MKKLSTSILLSLFFIQLLSAQEWNDRPISHFKNDWSIGFGFNAVNDAGSGFSEFFNVSDDWNFGNPIYVSAEYFLNNKFSVGATLSFNKYKEGKKIDSGIVLKGHEASYVAFDLAGKYSFRELLKSNAFEPYVLVGTGYTYIGDFITDRRVSPARGRGTFNTGIGCNYWFSPNWGLNAGLTGKIGIGGYVTNQFQSSIGVVYSILTKVAAGNPNEEN